MKNIVSYVRKYRFWLIGGVLALAGLYSLLSRSTETQPPITLPSQSSVTSPSPVASVSTQPAQTPLPSPSPTAEETAIGGLLFPNIDFTNQALYYYSDADSVFKKRFLASGQETILSPEIVFLNRAVWSPNKKLVLIELENRRAEDSDNRFYQNDTPEGFTVVGLLNLESQRFSRLNSGIIEYGFTNDNEIIYQYKDEKNNNLSVAKPNGSGWKNLAKLKEDVKVLGLDNSTMVQVAGERQLARYGSGGKRLDRYSIPADFILDQAAWAAMGGSAIYWVRQGKKVAIKSLIKNKEELIYSHPTRAAQLTILWDNKIGAIYLASFDGLVKLPVVAKP